MLNKSKGLMKETKNNITIKSGLKRQNGKKKSRKNFVFVDEHAK